MKQQEVCTATLTQLASVNIDTFLHTLSYLNMILLAYPNLQNSTRMCSLAETASSKLSSVRTRTPSSSVISHCESATKHTTTAAANFILLLNMLSVRFMGLEKSRSSTWSRVMSLLWTKNVNRVTLYKAEVPLCHI